MACPGRLCRSLARAVFAAVCATALALAAPAWAAKLRIASAFEPFSEEKMASLEKLTEPYHADATWFKSQW